MTTSRSYNMALDSLLFGIFLLLPLGSCVAYNMNSGSHKRIMHLVAPRAIKTSEVVDEGQCVVVTHNLCDLAEGTNLPEWSTGYIEVYCRVV